MGGGGLMYMVYCNKKIDLYVLTIKVPPYNTFHDSRQKKIKMYK